MITMDWKGVFSRVLYEEMREVFGAHGIESIHEEELDDIVLQCMNEVYWPCISEFKRKYDPKPVFRVDAPWGSARGHVGAIGNQGRPQGAARVIRRHK